jgi:hypothetical protein
MKIDYKITPDLGKLGAKLQGDVHGARRAGMINLVTEVEARARKYAPVKRSNLANSGTSNVNAAGTVGTVAFIAPYAKYVHEGTGLYGPHKTKIVPKGKKALFWPGAAHPVRAVKGMKANPFLLKAAKESDMQKLFTEGAENFLNKQPVIPVL